MQRAEKCHDIGGHDVVVVELPIGTDAVTLGRQRHRSGDREEIVRGRSILSGRFAARSPGAPTTIANVIDVQAF
jgi:hypothetical protein